MIRYIKSSAAILALMLVAGSCTKKNNFTMGNITAPSNVVINATIAGVDATHPNGDGSGSVQFTLTGENVLAYQIDYDASDGITFEVLPNGKITRKYLSPGTNTFRVTVVAYGPGAAGTTVTKDITIRYDYVPPAAIPDALIGATNSKTWVIDKDLQGHFGVGPYTGSATPDYYSAPPNDKAGCCNCFYTAKFTFAKNATTGAYSLTVASPDGAFTKTGALAGGLPGIPATGDEACYPYAGGTSSFAFIPSGTGVAATASTKVAILLGGNNTYIGYGAQLKEYEILSLTATTMYLRVQGTETGNAWYLKLKAI
jgi:Tfp pilus assembly protein PilX